MSMKDIFKEALPVIEKVAPAIATALGSPVAGVAISCLAKMFNGDEKDLSKLAECILSDENVQDKLCKVEEDYLSNIGND